MSLETILKNICSFLELLQKVRSSKNLKWSADSFLNAFKWAEYCQKIYSQSHGKPYERQLNEEIKKLNSLPWTLGDLTVDLNLLKNSVGLLSLALLQTEKPILNDHRLKQIQDKVPHNEFLKNSLEELILVNNLFQGIMSLKVEDEMEAPRQAETVQNDVPAANIVMEKLGLEASATLLIDYVQKILSFDFHDIVIQRMFLRDKLQQLASSKTSMVIVLKAYLILYETMRRDRRKAWQFFNSFVTDLVKKLDINFWASLPRDLALDLSAANKVHLEKLFDDLDGLSKNFEVHYNKNIIDEETGRLSLFSWKFVEDEKTRRLSFVVTYEWMRDWVDSLLTSRTGETSAEIVSRLALTSEVNIWRSSCQDLHRIDLLMPG